MLKRSNLINFSSFLVYLMPIGLLTGPLIPEIILIFISIIFLVISIKEKLWFYYKNYFTYFFISFYSYILLRSLLSNEPILSLESSLFYFRFGLFSLAIWFLIENEKKFIKRFTIFLLLTFLLALFDGIYQIYYDLNMFGFISPESRMTLTFSDSLYLGGFLSRLFPLLFATYLYSFSNKKSILLLLLLFIATDIVIFIAGERTAIGLMVISSIFIIFLINKYKVIRILSILISLIIIFIITAYSPVIYNRNIVSTYNQVTAKISGPINEGGLESRVLISPGHHPLFVTGLNMFKDQPLFGHGPKLFRALCSDPEYAYNENSCSTHPHNIYIQILAEIGIFGLLFFIILNSLIIFYSVKHIIYKFFYSRIIISDYQICLIACFLLTLWPLFPTQNLFNNWINIIFYLPIGFYLQTLSWNK